MRIAVIAAVSTAAFLSTNAYAGSSASVSTKAHYQFDITSSQIDGYNSTASSLSDSGTGNHTETPTGQAGFGGGTTGQSGDASAGWDASVSAPPDSTALMDQAWFPQTGQNGAQLPIYHVSNLTEFDSSVQITLYDDFTTSGSTNGDAGVKILNAVFFQVDCSSCTGLSTDYYNGAETYFAGDYFGAGTGAFSDSGSDTWSLNLTLLPESTAELFATVDSNVTLIANAAVPEPATWTMMILGCSALGAAARRRRSLLTA